MTMTYTDYGELHSKIELTRRLTVTCPYVGCRYQGSSRDVLQHLAFMRIAGDREHRRKS